MHGKVLIGLGWFVMLLAFSKTLCAVDAAPGDGVTEIGIRQQQVQRDFLNLEQKAMRVIEALQESDPDRANELQAALEWARGRILAGRMGSVASLLNAKKLMEAKELQPGMTADLEAMQRLLQQQPSEYERLQKQIEQVQGWLETTSELARDQWRLVRDGEKAQDLAAEQKRLNEQMASLERLLAAQQELRERTEKALAGGPSQMDREVEEQRRLERETRDLLAAMQGQGTAKRPGESGRPGQASKAAQSRQSGESKHVGGGSSRTAPADQNAPEDTEPPPENKVPEAGEKPVSVAIGEQWLSAEHLAAQKLKASMANQAAVIEELKLALREIRFERARQQELNPQKAKAAQDQLEKRTAKLFEDVVEVERQESEAGSTESSQRGPSPGNPNSLPGEAPSLSSPYAAKSAPSGPPRPSARSIAAQFPRGFSTGGKMRSSGLHPQSIVDATPWWNGVGLFRPLINQADQLMLKASSMLETEPLVVAAPVQKDAYVKLAIAEQALEQWLQDTRDKQRDTLRPLLKELLEKMLAQQESASLRTVTLNEIKEKGKWMDENHKALSAVREGEMEIGRLADQASDSVIQDGSSIVFSGLLTELRQALTDVIDLLGQEETGLPAQKRQREIEKLAADLIVATEQNIQTVSPENKRNRIKPPREPVAPPLIPLGTELRLLKAHQAWINERTAAIEKAFRATGRREHQAELSRLSEQQGKIFEMVRDLIKRISDAGNTDHVPL